MAQRLARSAVLFFAGGLIAVLLGGARGSAAQTGQTVDRPMPYMQAMNRIFNLLREKVKDSSQNRASMALVADLEWSTFSAKEAIPLRAAILPEPEQRAMLDGYRRQFLKLLRQEIDLEEALLNNDSRAAAALVAAIEATEDEGHDKFR